MFSYCLNSPPQYRDSSGQAAEEADLDEMTKDELFPQPMGGGNGDSWTMFTNSMKSAASGLQMAFGEKVGVENHYFFSNKSSKHTPKYKDIANKYGLNVDDEWNVAKMNGHRGRHTNAYHEFMTSMLVMIDEIANGNPDEFRKGIKILFDFILDNQWLPYAR